MDDALRKAALAALEALHAQHNDRTAYGRAKRKANATCAEFKNSPMSELIESGYMQSMGKQTQEAIDALRAALAAQADPEYLIRARWAGGVETYLDVKGVTVLGSGKVGIDVDAPTTHPLADDPDAMAVLGAAQPQQATAQAEPVAWRWKERINDEFDSGWRLTSFEPPTGPRTIAIEPLYNHHAQPRKRTEQDAWEDWAAKVRPAGDVDEVQRRWLASPERRDFMDEDAQPSPPHNEGPEEKP